MEEPKYRPGEGLDTDALKLISIGLTAILAIYITLSRN